MADIRSIEISIPAKEDLEEIKNYISKDDPRSAEKVLESILKVFGLLKLTPEMGKQRPDIGGNIYSIPTGKYVIFYMFRGSTISVLRVGHGSQDLDNWF